MITLKDSKNILYLGIFGFSFGIGFGMGVMYCLNIYMSNFAKINFFPNL